MTEKVFKVEFDRLSDFLYTSMQADKPVTSLSYYKGKLWKIWYWAEPDRVEIHKCDVPITAECNFIEFEVLTGKSRVVEKIALDSQKHHFVVTRPTYVEILEKFYKEG